jgi:hypothetical protein
MTSQNAALGIVVAHVKLVFLRENQCTGNISRSLTARSSYRATGDSGAAWGPPVYIMLRFE